MAAAADANQSLSGTIPAAYQNKDQSDLYSLEQSFTGHVNFGSDMGKWHSRSGHLHFQGNKPSFRSRPVRPTGATKSAVGVILSTLPNVEINAR